MTDCPYCGKHNPLHVIADYDTAPPREGDVSICVGCGGLALFTLELTLRKPTAREMLELSYDKDVQAAKDAWRKMHRMRSTH
jgi:hypothetical protein